MTVARPEPLIVFGPDAQSKSESYRYKEPKAWRSLVWRLTSMKCYDRRCQTEPGYHNTSHAKAHRRIPGYADDSIQFANPVQQVIALLVRGRYGLKAHLDYSYVDADIIAEFITSNLSAYGTVTVEEAGDRVFTRRIRKIRVTVQQYFSQVGRQICVKNKEDQNLTHQLHEELRGVASFLVQRLQLRSRTQAILLLLHYEMLVKRYQWPLWLLGRLHEVLMFNTDIHINYNQDLPIIHAIWYEYKRMFKPCTGDEKTSNPWGYGCLSRRSPTFFRWTRRRLSTDFDEVKDEDIAIAFQALFIIIEKCSFCGRKHNIERCGRWWRQRAHDDFRAYAPLRRAQQPRPPAGRANPRHWEQARQLQAQAPLEYEVQVQQQREEEEIRAGLRLEYWTSGRLDISEEEYVQEQIVLFRDIEAQQDESQD